MERGGEQERTFMRAILDDLQALEEMLDRGMFETGRRRVGAEQEMFLIDRDMSPAPVALTTLDRAGDPRLTTELALFNLEANATPVEFGGHCLRDLERELEQLLGAARAAAAGDDADAILCGILPTLRSEHLGLDHMTPKPRYRELNDATCALRGGSFDVSIEGIDELHTRHDNVMMEACNTSFQIHFQVAPDEFARVYNAAQLVTAPVLAAAANSPLLLGRRLWHETRIALFTRGVDSRSQIHQARAAPARVSFGDRWVDSSILEIFRDQVARHRVVLPIPTGEPAAALLARGAIPTLDALRAHNGTVYRWNRACYGITDGVPHLRVENRALPAGPTVRDQIANAALFFGLLGWALHELGDVAAAMRFDRARTNFFAAAQHGLDARLWWIDDALHAADRLIRDQLLPRARAGLVRSGVDEADADLYLGVIQRRVASRRTGARWMLDSLARMDPACKPELRARALTSRLVEQQRSGAPVHEWEVEGMTGEAAWRASFRTVGQFMTTDLFTVREGDLLDLAASVMDWRHIEHVPVEDDQGRLVGLITYRTLLRLLARGATDDARRVAVADVMKRDPITVTPETPTLDAMRLMRERKVGCLPVIVDDKLVGIITQSDLIDVSARLLETYLS